MSDTNSLTETDRVRRIQDKHAPGYDRQISFFERVLFGEGRQWVCSRVRGKTLELAVGTARNLPLYSSDIELTGVDLSPEMLALGKRRAEEIGHPARLQEGDAQNLEFQDESFDTVVCTLGFCTIPDPRRGLEEAHRVLIPGGSLVLLEHVRSPSRLVRIGQRLLEPLAVRFEADHLLRDPLDHLEEVGFEITELERSKWGIVERVAARKPVAA
ncbi:MAG: methyltransferase domain-containing protein [Actinomycetota bacterium]|nr:methyltransferase domain-containing protein [Actinomycetota bacterium]